MSQEDAAKTGFFYWFPQIDEPVRDFLRSVALMLMVVIVPVVRTVEILVVIVVLVRLLDVFMTYLTSLSRIYVGEKTWDFSSCQFFPNFYLSK